MPSSGGSGGGGYNEGERRRSRGADTSCVELRGRADPTLKE